MTAPVLIRQAVIKVNGTNLAVTTMDKLLELIVDTRLGMPDLAILRFEDDSIALSDGSIFQIGKLISINLPSLSGTTDTSVEVMTGTITGVEPHFNDDNTVRLTVTAHDNTYKLNGATQIISYVNVMDSDIVSTVASSAGVTAQVDATSAVHPYVIQDNISNLQFLGQLAYRNGYVLLLHGGKVVFKKSSSLGLPAPANLIWGTNLRDFRPRLSIPGQVGKVEARGWDVEGKTAFVGTATSTSSEVASPRPNVSGAAPVSSVTRYVVEERITTADVATKVAQATLDRVLGDVISADGIAIGDGKLIAGASLTITKVGTKFSGTYFVTSAEHRYTPEGYDTHFSVEGRLSHTYGDLMLMDPPTHQRQWGGVYPAIVTNVNDTEKSRLRIKVKYPWMKDDLQSDWARIAVPNAGPDTGIIWMPSVNDEVLVGFEFGDFNRPYVIGGLWNGRDGVPFTQSEVIADGKPKLRGFKTPNGNQMTFIEDSSTNKISIQNTDNTIKILIDMTDKKITIESTTGGVDVITTGKMLLKSGADGTEIKSDGKILIETSSGDVEIKGLNVKANGSASFEVKGGVGTVEASGVLGVKGSVVNIN